LTRVGEDSPAGCGSAQESGANEAYALSEAQAIDEDALAILCVRLTGQGDNTTGPVPSLTQDLETGVVKLRRLSGLRASWQSTFSRLKCPRASVDILRLLVA
jgi:hypothetical protein